jgi:proteasome beta subunit
VESCDFLSLLKEQGHLPTDPLPTPAHGTEFDTTEGTTILAVRYREGVLIAGDRRATMGNTVVYDRADKVLSIDDDAVMALAGSPAIAYEMARLLEVSFQHYRRSQLQVLSLDGKLRILSRLLRDNLSLALQGIGAVVPIFAAYDIHASAGKIFFCDVLGAHFESVDFCTTGSGSPIIRGALYHHNRWQERLAEMDESRSLELILKMLETAAEFDTATGGWNPRTRIFPQVQRITAAGIETVAEDVLESLYHTELQSQS